MDIYSEIKKDHKKLKELLNKFSDLDNNDTYREVLFKDIKEELVAHTKAEEAILYNSMRVLASDDSNVIHSYKEHAEVDGLVCALEKLIDESADWKIVAEKFKESLEHHLKDEEEELFKQAKKIFSKEESIKMGEAFRVIKEDIDEDSDIEDFDDTIYKIMPERISKELKHIDLDP